VGPETGLDDVEKRKFLNLPGLELRPLGRPARSQSFTDFVVIRITKRFIHNMHVGMAMFVCPCLRQPASFSSRTPGRISIKSDMKVMLLEVTPNSQFLISHTISNNCEADPRTSEVEAALAPLQKYGTSGN
jgi:hypothetical protein